MPAGFGVTVVADGQVRVMDLPHPLYPSKRRPYIKGLQLSVPAVAQTYSVTYTPAEDVELLSIAMAASGYGLGDYWWADVGTERLLDSIYTKELPESVLLGTPWSIVYPVAAGTEIKLSFNNASGTAKRVWWNLHMLR
ncbi:hypothetical protein Tmar_0051 [Thermaerobacter marianensis DSM 12885]|uniref:Uncharacterized protein n=1 Tax=Thermaerobacter marianensis (strain ATCC 700841 / DSM 12885 / JCM 10246 / 7p75a) TaxID=644966 RepID=E6SKI9_THEM7|nr:hypothetical protein [Thermaerobacter marianensis]ADU50176.1 hypothetical protein Tmar_0051 [Thermaerobacter marianensis DSM 12885]